MRKKFQVNAIGKINSVRIQNATNGSGARQRNKSSRLPAKQHQQMTQFHSMDRMSAALRVHNMQMSQDVSYRATVQQQTNTNFTHKLCQCDFIRAN